MSILKKYIFILVSFTLIYGFLACDQDTDETSLPEVIIPTEPDSTTTGGDTNSGGDTSSGGDNTDSGGDTNSGGGETDGTANTIDLTHWKVTLPIGNPTEIEPPEILNYRNIDVLKEFMYDDSDGGLVFYTYPGSTTANTSYSRTELREQMVSGSNSTNWTFAQGGYLRGVLAMDDITKDSDGKYHRTIVMQIHGRLTDEQRDLIGEDDNNAPPILKIYWDKGYVRVKTKILKDLNASDTEILHTDAWGDDDGYTFPEYVGLDKKFTLEVKVSEGRMEVLMNGESKVYDDIHIQKWGIFENYFKAGNYLSTLDKDAYARVKYYELEVSH